MHDAENPVVGVLGGGQLGRMLVEAANRLNIKICILDTEKAPAKQISNHDDHVTGSFKDVGSIRKIAKKCDVLTVEIEHVDTYALEAIAEEYPAIKIEPSWRTIRTIQDKFRQKQHLSSKGVPVAEYVEVVRSTTEDLARAGKVLGYPFMLKSRTQAYDGRGNYAVKSEADFSAALDALQQRPLYAEKWAGFRMELAVMVVKTEAAQISFPCVETVHENSILQVMYAPARGVPKETTEAAQKLAKRAVSTFEGKGVFGVEMFLLHDDTLLVNEIAPRPHNSGHYAIEACGLSQFDAHLRAILDIPIPPESLNLNCPAIMFNILTGSSPTAHLQAVALAKLIPNASIHLYGKPGPHPPNRKVGHVTVTAPTMHLAERRIAPLLNTAPPEPHVSVAVLMGSDSDLPVLMAGIDLLKDFAITTEVRITSAHRTPTHMAEYASTAAQRGVKVIIAAAGGAAHLPGMAASYTSLPVIGVPVKASQLDGTDSLLSIVQMPKGVPVATVGINNAVNAALLAARIIGIEQPEVRKKVEEYAANARNEVMMKDARLLELGPSAYAKDMKRK